MDEARLAGLLAHVASELQSEPGEQPTAVGVATLAVEMVADTRWASIAVRGRRGRFMTLAATGAVAEEADRLQFAQGQGPALGVARDDEWVRSGDVAHDDRWPGWGEQAAGLGVGSVLSVPLEARGEHLGALNFYADRTSAFGRVDDVDLALLFAVHAAHALSSERLIDGLRVAVASRHDIGVAQGIICERYGLTVDQSFALLRRISSRSNTKISELARQIIETGAVPTSEGR
jgi:GAF domain-containing protein